MTDRHSSSDSIVYIFCPNGCTFDTAPDSRPWDHCPKCGALRTPETEGETARFVDPFDPLSSNNSPDTDEMDLIVMT